MLFWKQCKSAEKLRKRELDLPLFFWDIYCLPGELSGSTCQPARSQQLHSAVPCSGLVPRDLSETREMSQGTNPLKHFLKSNGGGTKPAATVKQKQTKGGMCSNPAEALAEEELSRLYSH